MTRSRYPFVAAAMMALAITFASPWLCWPALDGLIDDAGTLVRYEAGAEHAPSTSVAVLAVDGDSLAARDLRGTPRLLFGPVWGDLTTSLIKAGAKAVVYDFMFALSVDDWLRRQKVGQGGVDGPFLEAIQDHADKVVLARSGGQLPAMPYRLALDAEAHPERLGLAEIVSDPDGVAREMAARFPGLDGTLLASLHEAAVVAAGGQARRSAPAGTRPRLDGPLETMIPTIGLGAWRRCLAAAPDGGDLARRVAGRVVFVGSVLPEEDRRSAGDRLVLRAWPRGPAPPPPSEPCTLGEPRPSAPATGWVPAVYLHAAATAARLEGRALAPAGAIPVATLAGITAMTAGGIAVAWSIPAVIAGLAGLAVLVLAAAVLAPMAFIHLTVSPALAGLVATAACVLAFRFLVIERRERLIRTAFGRYLSPTLVAELAAQETLPALGGETRQVTVLFSDIAGYTRRVDGRPPDEAIALVNRCLSTMVRAVDANGGYVDKFIGDAVMALWNAPAAQPDHARRALAAGLEAMAALDAEEAGAPDPIRFRIGIETGEASVGNMGTEGRLSYTAIGDTVNLAARLEALGKPYGVPVLVGPGAAAAIGLDQFLALDDVVPAGMSRPVTVFLPRACVRREEADAFAAAHALAQDGHPGEAKQAFEALARTSTVLAAVSRLRAGKL
ncbi:adenylate/guanylate cyclase domain-containing protein [uncultured Alsobacter sp.]|uniref:adenylate/guanylate cyclase domain-containing protein n=1 Tax=uncultured Alsobacter sp. TaxID=1748258 RepID=UPI0025FB0383|nr:adenylate/guanylate cyclase domain-containing protein [uncultured Alsobacter sp.]